MAIAIKTIPTLKGKAASQFEKNALNAVTNASTLDFSGQIKSGNKILAKSKLK